MDETKNPWTVNSRSTAPSVLADRVNEVDEYDQEFEPSDLFVRLFGATLRDIMRRLAFRHKMFTQLDDIDDDDLVATDAHRVRLVKWFQRMVGSMENEGPAQLVDQYYLKMCLRPGEMRSFAIEQPASIVSELSVLAHYRGPSEYQYLADRSTRQLARIVQEELEAGLVASRRGRREPLALVLALIEVVQLYLRSMNADCSFKRYVIFELECIIAPAGRFADLASLPHTMPLIVQVLNGFHVTFHGRTRPLESFLNALVVWMLMLRRHRSPDCTTERGISLRAWIDDILPA